MNESPTSVTAADAPRAIGPYVQAMHYAGILYCSGSLPLDPVTGLLDNTDPSAEVVRSLRNLEAVCREAGTSLDRCLKITLYTTNLATFAQINDTYAAHFDGRNVPARTTIGVAELPLGATVEIDAIVALS